MTELKQDNQILGMSIAPRLEDPLVDKKYWFVEDWINLERDNFKDWDTAILIFNDRIQFRYLDPIQYLIDQDDKIFGQFRHRRFGFSIMALNCLLIETLAQFYDGLKESPKDKPNAKFYVEYLTKKSLILKSIFTNDLVAEVFYKTIRCGILHQAETKENSKIKYLKSNDKICPFELLEDHKSIIVYRKAFQKFVNDEFEIYKQTILTLSEDRLVENFKKKMGYICRTK